MEFHEYVRGDEAIRATETAYKVIYEAQGFVPASGKASLKKAGEADGKDGSNPADNPKGAAAGKPKKSG